MRGEDRRVGVRGRGRGSRRRREDGLNPNGDGEAVESPVQERKPPVGEDGTVTTLSEVTARGGRSLQEVQARRRQLLGLALMVFVLVASGAVLLSYASETFFDRTVEILNFSVLRVSFVALAIAFSLYVYDKERRLSRVEGELIEERILSTALSNRLRELSALSQAGKAVASVLSLDDVLKVILESAQELLGATEGSIMLLDEEKRSLRVAASVGLPLDARGAVIQLGEGVAGWVAEFREPVILRGDVSDPRFRHFVPKGRQVRSAMSAPLYARAEPVGVLNVSVSTDGREYRDHDLRALTVFAEHAAVAIANARLYEREKKASAKLADLDERRREFLATVTHDLKTPLTSILGYVKLLQRASDRLSSDEAREFTEVIERQGQRILEMVEQLIMATRLEEGAPTLTREALDLRAIVEDAVEAFRGVPGNRTIDVIVPEDFPTVYGDRSAVEHILANLLDNAVKYSPEGAGIDVDVEVTGEEIMVSVTDDGPGIPESALPHVFERYRRAEVGAGSSVGLGLFIVRSLTQAQGGEVDAANVPGRGARISFSLPLRRSRSE
ncbi:MAG: ATP-binding protein [Actinomycetota bacterium]